MKRGRRLWSVAVLAAAVALLPAEGVAWVAAARQGTLEHSLPLSFLSPATPAGAPWAPNVRVNDDAGTAIQQHPAIAVDAGGNAYAVWSDYRNGNSDIYFSYRPRGGSWGSNVRVNDDAGTADQSAPSIAVDDGGNAYAVWTDMRDGNANIYFALRPAGDAWGANVKVNDDTLGAIQHSPSIAVDPSGNAHAVWEEWGEDLVNDKIYSSYRPNGGTWAAAVRVNDDSVSANRDYPSIAVDANANAYAVWRDERSGNSDIYSSFRPAGGAWETNTRVNDDAGTSLQAAPAIAADAGGNAFAVWSDDRRVSAWKWDIFFSLRPAGGAWGANVRVNSDTGPSSLGVPSIGVNASGNALVVWRDYNTSNIYSAYRSADGAWGSSVKVNDDPGTASQDFPAVTIDSKGNGYVVWEDARSGNEDIYFAYRPFFRVFLPLVIRN